MISPRDLELLTALCRSKAGLRIQSDKPYLIETRLAPVVRRLGVDDIDQMFNVLRETREDKLIWAIIEAMASSETAFFRDRDQFAQFERLYLPTIFNRRPDQPVRILCAGCSTGQEVYSIALACLSSGLPSPLTQVEITGADLSARALEKAQKGIYSQFEVQRGLPIRKLIDHFTKQDDLWEASAKLRQMIRWRRVNLLADLKPLGQMDIIFARNLVNAMDPAAQPRIVANLSAILADDGLILVGRNEQLGFQNSDLRLIDGAENVWSHASRTQAAA